MSIRTQITDFLNEYCGDGKILVIVDGTPFLYTTYYPSDLEECIKELVNLFIYWAEDNESEECNTPEKLFDYCMIIHSFGGICQIYFQDSDNDDFVKVDF